MIVHKSFENACKVFYAQEFDHLNAYQFFAGAPFFQNMVDSGYCRCFLKTNSYNALEVVSALLVRGEVVCQLDLSLRLFVEYVWEAQEFVDLFDAELVFPMILRKVRAHPRELFLAFSLDFSAQVFQVFYEEYQYLVPEGPRLQIKTKDF